MAAKSNLVIRGLVYFLGLLIYGLILYQGLAYENQLRTEVSQTYNSGPLITYSTAFSLLFGATLALPRLVKQISLPGTWEVDWVKILVVGVPTLLLACGNLLFFQTPLGQVKYLVWLISLPSYVPKFGFLAGIISGFTIVNSICRVKADTSKVYYC